MSSALSLLHRQLRFWRRGGLTLAVLAPVLTLLAGAPAVAQTAPAVAGRPAPTVAARKQVLREALRLPATADLRLLETTPDPLGFAHEQYQVYYQGVKVEHGRVRIHSRAGKVETVSGEAATLAAGHSAQPRLTEAAALQRALTAVGARVYKWQLPTEEAALKQQTGKAAATYQPHGELVWVGDFRLPEPARPATRPLVLAWKFDIYAHEPTSRAHYYIDAQTGGVVLRDAIIKHLNTPGAQFTTRYLGARTSITDNTGSGYRLRETVTGKGVTTLNLLRSQTFAMAVDFTDNDNNWTAAEHNNLAKDNAALDAHLGAQITQDFWTTVHGRDSYDDKGSVLLSYVHYGFNIDNAFWDGTAMLYGDGNNKFKPLTAVDVCAHEVGHAVCDATADLVYQDESGALNEGFSDIWGACVENHFDPAKQTWLIGEDITLPAFGAALRSLSNPNQFDQPDTYKGTKWFSGSGDHGGVHTNSGVLNFWFFLLSQGGIGTNDFATAYNVAGIGIAKAGKIAYRAERFYLTANSTYSDARRATLQAAIDLHGLGSAEATATARAWHAVGVGTATGAAEAAPTLSAFAPGSGIPGDVVTLTGTTLGATFAVAFNGVAAKGATLVSGTSVTVTVPAGATTGPISLTTPSGTVTSAGNFVITAVGAAPVITSFAPAAGQVQGGAVTLTGTGFLGASAVRFNGATAAFTLVNATTITATVPATATSGTLTVTTPNGTGAAPTAFAVLPNITAFTPTSSVAGGTVNISGTSFTGALNVKFNGVYAPAFTVVNATTITATVPTGATSGPITVRTPSGTATSAAFTVTPSLAITAFSPTSGPAATVVSIQGRGFTGTTAVSFGGVNAPVFTVASDLELWATVPAGAQTGNIVVTAPLGNATAPSAFTVIVVGGPTISSFTPASGAPGTAVTITGTNFTGATAVKFNGTAAAFTVVNATTITTTAPAGLTPGPLSVTTPLNTAVSAASFLLPPTNDLCSGTLPVLACGSTVLGTTTGSTTTGDPTSTCTTSITAPGVFYQFVGTGGSVTVSTCNAATNFDTKLFVFTGTCGTYTCVGGNDDTSCASPGNGNSSEVTFASVVGTNYFIFVSGFSSSKGNFGLTATCAPVNPSISSFTPTSGPAGTSVVLTGTNFTGASAVTFNGTAATTFSVGSATSLTATVPVGATTGPIGVTVPGGAGTSDTNFTVTAGAPTLASLAPASGPVGTSVTLTGTGFSGATTIRFNGTAATVFNVATATTATATVPVGATSGSVTLTTPGGTSNGQPFTVITNQAPTALGLSPQSVNENVPANTAIGNFSTTDADASDTHTYTLVSGAGSTDNGAFSISGNQLRITASPDFETKASYAIRVRSTDAGGLFTEQPFTITVLDQPEDLVISSVAGVFPGVYHNITVLNGGVAVLQGDITVTGTLLVQAGGAVQTRNEGGCALISGPGSFVLAAGARLNICSPQGISASGATGNVQVTGGRTFSPNAIYLYDGIAAQITGSGLPARVFVLAKFDTGTLALSQAVAVRFVVALVGPTGNIALNGQTLTLRSDADTTAFVLNDNGGAVLGATAVVQRYVGGPATPSYHHLAAPVAAAPVSDLATAGFVPKVNVAYNAIPRPAIPAATFPNVLGYDEARGGAASSDFGLGYFSPASLATVLPPGRGHTVYLPGGKTPDFVGTLTTGDVPLSLTATGNPATNGKAGWALLGNPYPQPIDWDLATIPAGLDPTIYVWYSTGGSNGAYRVRNATTQVGNLTDGVLALGQAFFARVTGAGPVSFTFQNAMRAQDISTPLGRPAAGATGATGATAATATPLLRLNLTPVGAPAGQADATFLTTAPAATTAYDDALDALRPGRNVGVPTLATLINGQEAAINALPEAVLTGGTETVVELTAVLPTAGAYTLAVGELANWGTASVELLDRLTNTRYALSQQPVLTLSATRANQEIAGRFAVVLNGQRVLGTSQYAVYASPLTVYPNPAAGGGAVRVTGAAPGQPVAVLDLTGRCVATVVADATGGVEVRTKGLAAGTYVVRATDGRTTRLVVQ